MTAVVPTRLLMMTALEDPINDSWTTITIVTSTPLASTAAASWDVFGVDFGGWAAWTTGITKSDLNGPVAVGVECINKTSVGVLTQELTAFDEVTRSLTYTIRSGMPAPIAGASNSWSIEEAGEGSSRFVGRAVFELKWWAIPLRALLRCKMDGSLSTFTGEVSSRMAAA